MGVAPTYREAVPRTLYRPYDAPEQDGPHGDAGDQQGVGRPRPQGFESPSQLGRRPAGRVGAQCIAQPTGQLAFKLGREIVAQSTAAGGEAQDAAE